MKKITLVETISDWLMSDNAGDAKGQYHPEIIKQHLNDVFNQAVYQTYLDGKKNSNFAQLDAWSRNYPVAVVGQMGAKAHAFLPFAPIGLPDGQGIQAIYDHDNLDVMFAPIESDAQVIFRELEVDTFDTTPMYTLEQNSLAAGAGEASHLLRFEKLPVAPATLITTVDIMMIVSLENLDDFDDVAMPSSAEDSLIRQVIDIMSKKPKSDTLNDQNNQIPIQ
jgi:hypothetical protein